MGCPRCHDVMVKGRFYDVLENDGQFYVGAWRWGSRCIACGKVSDLAIEQNRQMARQSGTVDERTSNLEAGAA